MSFDGRPIVAVDLDEVLGGFLPALCNYHNATTPQSTAAAAAAAAAAALPLTVDSFHSYEFHQVWGGTPDEATRKVHAFFESDYFREGVEVIEGAVDALRSLQQVLRFVIVTSRQHVIADATKAWVSQHFPGIFEAIEFGNHYTIGGDSNAGVKRSKPDMCEEIGAGLLVDDSMKYARQCSARGIRVLLFGDYKYSLGETPANTRRVSNWVECAAALREYAVESVSRRPVTGGVTVRFTIPDQTAEETDSFNFTPDPNLAPGVAATGPVRMNLEGEPQRPPPAGSFDYSGLHDDGDLGALREGGPHACVLAAIHAAKVDSNAHLTALIEREAAACAASKEETSPRSESQRKRQKV